MNKFLSRAVAASTIVVGLAVVGTSVPAHAATAVSAAPHAVAGTYTMYYNWGTGYNPDTWTVSANHTFSDSQGYNGTWSRSKRNVTFTYSSPGCAVYLGKITKAGFNSLAHPGTMSCPGGASGTWYAIKTSHPQGGSSTGRSASGV